MNKVPSCQVPAYRQLRSSRFCLFASGKLMEAPKVIKLLVLWGKHEIILGSNAALLN
jgi:hypothetical protein